MSSERGFGLVSHKPQRRLGGAWWAVVLSAVGMNQANAQCDPETMYGEPRLGAGDRPQSLAVGDLNGDGVLDMAVANGDSNDVSILLGRGDGTFETQQRFGVGEFAYGLALGDLNGDSILDVAVTNLFSNNASVLIGHGDGTFDTHQLVVTGGGPQSVVMADLDGDGNLDMAIANGSPAT